MDYLSHNVSENLKRLRQSKGMSLDQVAEQTGVSKSMLAQIEKGTANPSLGVLGKITSGLRKPEGMIPTKELEGQYKVFTCFPFEDSQSVEIYRIDVEPGGVYTSGSHGERTREYITVIDGALTIECHDHSQKVEKSQVYKFETDQPHIYRNEGSERASCMCFFLDYTNIR